MVTLHLPVGAPEFYPSGQVTLGEIESTGNRRNSLSRRKAAAFQGWHEPDESRDSRPAL
jgi:hypothetical protein